MKKIVALAVAVIMIVAVMCTPVSALDLDKKLLRPQLYLQDQVEWKWEECLEAGATEAPLIALGETRNVELTDFSNFATLNSTGGFQYGFQICDETLSTTEAGDTSTIAFTISDITFKADGYDDIVVPIAGSYTKELATKQYDWGVGDNNANFNEEVTAAISAVIGTDGKDIFDYFTKLTSVSYTLTYDAYNGEGAEGAVAEPMADETAPAGESETAPATEAETAPAPAETEAPVAEVDAAPAPEAEAAPVPATGIALAVIPAVIALGAVAVFKKH